MANEVTVLTVEEVISAIGDIELIMSDNITRPLLSCQSSPTARKAVS